MKVTNLNYVPYGTQEKNRWIAKVRRETGKPYTIGQLSIMADAAKNIGNTAEYQKLKGLIENFPL